MTQPEETTAALIARLHEELKESKAECLQWRRDIDEERTVRQTHEGRSQSLHRALAKERSAFEAAESARIAWAERCIAIEKERDEQRARAEKAEAELVQERLKSQTLLKCKNIWLDRCTKARKECDEFNASHAALDRLLAERTRERDEARACYGSVCGQLAEQKQSYARLLDLRDRLTRERDEAREQLGRVQADYQVFMLGTAHGAKCWADECGWHCAEGCKAKYARKCVAVAELKTAREQLVKLEWPIMFGWGHEDACALCKGCKPTDRPKYTADNYGHRPTCWFAKKEAGANKIRNHRKDCPARTADDVAWVDSQWQVNGCRTSPIEGPRPNPIGCEGCRCAKADEGAAKPPTPREQWNTKQAHYDHWLDAIGYTLLGVDWSGGNSLTVKTNRPVKPGASFVYEPSSGIWKLVDNPSGRPARPEPRFKVGEKVVADAHGKTWTGVIERPRIDGGAWFYDVRCANSVILSGEESQIKPAPKFAVGEWVTHRRVGSGMVAHVAMGVSKDEWYYNIGLDNEPGFGAFESDLTAQTPQHRHDCKDSIFLGRHGGFDLWWRPAMREVVTVEPAITHYYTINGDLYNPAAIEAWRRAVARGLMKS